MTTIETKITNNGRLILKVDGKRQSYDDAMRIMNMSKKHVINIITDRGQTYTGGYNQDRYIFEDDASGNWLQFYSRQEAVNRLSSGNFREENFIRKFADQDEINKKIQAEIETLDEQRHTHEVEITTLQATIASLNQSLRFFKEILAPKAQSDDDRDFYNKQIDSLTDNIKLLQARKITLLEQCDKIFEQINQLNDQIILVDF